MLFTELSTAVRQSLRRRNETLFDALEEAGYGGGNARQWKDFLEVVRWAECPNRAEAVSERLTWLAAHGVPARTLEVRNGPEDVLLFGFAEGEEMTCLAFRLRFNLRIGPVSEALLAQALASRQPLARPRRVPA